jgi:isoquinoline 1-oxidoreductase subunit beta
MAGKESKAKKPRGYGTYRQSDTILAQLQGGLVFGLTAGLYGEVTLKNGRV